MSEKTTFFVLLSLLVLSIALLVFAQHNLELQSLRQLR
ncbi:MAG: hypothetical protein JWL89_173 [Candidatus Saccharibacteria bacterium]|jgi:hypothetical protein|nr:hypothetical protein [Candidatus Saccharibacteria bacterium]